MDDIEREGGQILIIWLIYIERDGRTDSNNLVDIEREGGQILIVLLTKRGKDKGFNNLVDRERKDSVNKVYKEREEGHIQITWSIEKGMENRF